MIELFYKTHFVPLLLIFILGAIIGSFLNVVIYRFTQQLIFNNKKLNLIFPASHCPRCQHPIRPWHNIPILSYLLLKGRCHDCHEKISVQYPLLELFTALASAGIIFHFGFKLAGAEALLFLWLIIPMIIIDIHHHILPDSLTYCLLALGLLFNIHETFAPLISALIGSLGGYVFFFAIAWLFEKIAKKEGLGQGDFKLLAALGAWVGWPFLPLLILMASLLGLITVMLRTLLVKNSLRHPIAFGPFLAISGLIILLYGRPLMAWYWGLF